MGTRHDVTFHASRLKCGFLRLHGCPANALLAEQHKAQGQGGEKYSGGEGSGGGLKVYHRRLPGHGRGLSHSSLGGGGMKRTFEHELVRQPQGPSSDSRANSHSSALAVSDVGRVLGCSWPPGIRVGGSQTLPNLRCQRLAVAYKRSVSILAASAAVEYCKTVAFGELLKPFHLSRLERVRSFGQRPCRNG